MLVAEGAKGSRLLPVEAVTLRPRSSERAVVPPSGDTAHPRNLRPPAEVRSPVAGCWASDRARCARACDSLPRAGVRDPQCARDRGLCTEAEADPRTRASAPGEEVVEGPRGRGRRERARPGRHPAPRGGRTARRSIASRPGGPPSEPAGASSDHDAPPGRGRAAARPRGRWPGRACRGPPRRPETTASRYWPSARASSECRVDVRAGGRGGERLPPAGRRAGARARPARPAAARGRARAAGGGRPAPSPRSRARSTPLRSPWPNSSCRISSLRLPNVLAKSPGWTDRPSARSVSRQAIQWCPAESISVPSRSQSAPPGAPDAVSIRRG